MSYARYIISEALDMEAYPEVESLIEEQGELIKVDTSSIGDRFGQLFERGIELSLVDAEARIEADEDMLDLFREHVRKAILEYGRDHREVQNLIEQGIQFRREIDASKDDVDARYPMEEEKPDTSIYTYLEMYIDRMTLGDMATAYDTLECKQKNKEISWYTFVQCGLALTSRLAYNTHKACGWWDECDRLRAMNQTHHMKTSSYEDRFFGEMNFSMEDAIDKMREAREYAYLNYLSVDKAWYQLHEEMDELDPMWTPTLEELY